MLRSALAVTSLVALATLALLVPPTRIEAAAPPAKAADPKPVPAADTEIVKTVQGMFKDLKMVTLDNGLRVYLLPIKARRPSARWSPTASVRLTKIRIKPACRTTSNI